MYTIYGNYILKNIYESFTEDIDSTTSLISTPASRSINTDPTITGTISTPATRLIDTDPTTTGLISTPASRSIDTDPTTTGSISTPASRSIDKTYETSISPTKTADPVYISPMNSTDPDIIKRNLEMLDVATLLLSVPKVTSNQSNI